MREKPIMACITAQPHCEKIVKAALKLSKQLNKNVIVLTVLPIKDTAENRAAALKSLKLISDSCGVNITIIYSDNPAMTIAAQASIYKPIHIFTGEDSGFLKSFCKYYKSSPISVVVDGVFCTVPAAYDVSYKTVG